MPPKAYVTSCLSSETEASRFPSPLNATDHTYHVTRTYYNLTRISQNK